MAVSKRTRFEVLRRDDYTCRYCGQSAPDVKLTVDHVMPKALGGTDAPSNLVAACVDCNAGKASSAPDAATVADVHAEALRWAERTRQAYAVLVEDVHRADEYVEEFREAWTDSEIERGWQASIARFYRMGVPIELVVDAARRALSNTKVAPGVARFKYMCGIIWNQVSAVTEAVSTHDALEGAWVTEDTLTEGNYEAFLQGRHAGYEDGYREGRLIYRDSDRYHRLLCSVTDRAYPVLRAEYEAAVAELSEAWRAA